MNSTNITVRNLTLTKNYEGVLFVHTENSRIENVSVSNNNYGIHLYFSNNNILYGNIANSNYDYYGIYLLSSSNNVLQNNIANSNNNCGICLWNSTSNTLYSNIANSNRCGIWLRSSSDNTLKNNIANSNLRGSGICMSYSSSNILTSNTASNNKYGIYLYYLSNNKIYLNNFINNTDNTYPHYFSSNVWNSTSKMTYMYNKTTYTNYLGNYWSDYTGSDADGDGIGDTHYSIYGDNSDKHPLMQPWVGATLQKGDLNGDDQITSADAAIALGMAVRGEYNPTADVNGDGSVTSLDALMILQICGLES